MAKLELLNSAEYGNVFENWKQKTASIRDEQLSDLFSLKKTMFGISLVCSVAGRVWAFAATTWNFCCNIKVQYLEVDGKK